MDEEQQAAAAATAAAEAAKASAAPAVLSDNPEKDAAALAAYEAAQNQHKTPEQLESEAAAAAAALEAEGNDPAKAAVAEAGLDFESMTASVLETGDITPESYEALAKIGISDEMVKTYLKGIEATAEVQIETVLAPAGGAEGFAKVSAWAASALSDADLAEYNTAVNNPTTAAFAVKALVARFEAAEGKAPSVIIAPGATPREARGVQGFESSAEVVAAMRDARYKTDPAYQRQVQQRLAASPGVF